MARGKNNSSSRWKGWERVVATLLDGKRLPNNGFGQPDVIAGNLAVQVKTKRTVPKWLTDAVDQSIRDADLNQQPVVVVVHARAGLPSKRYLIADLDFITSDEIEKEPA